MRIPSSGMMKRSDPRDRWARPDSKLRRVLDRLWDGRWHAGSDLHAAFGEFGWAWDGAIAQLRAKGIRIDSRPLPGRDEFEYQLTRPVDPALEPHLRRTDGVLADARRTGTLFAVLLLLLLASSTPRLFAYHFAVVGDTHASGAYDNPDLTQSPAWEQIAVSIRRSHPDFVVHLGDEIAGAHDVTNWWQQMDAALELEDKLPPTYHVVGNHDVLYSLDAELMATRLSWWEAIMGQNWWALRVGQDHFVGLSSENPGEVSQIAGDQLRWLQWWLRKGRRIRNLFVFVHEPLWLGTYYGGCRFDSNWWADVAPLLHRARRAYVFAGHQHLYWNCGEIEGAHYLVSGGGGGLLAYWRATQLAREGYDAVALHHWLEVTVPAQGGEPEITVHWGPQS